MGVDSLHACLHKRWVQFSSDASMPFQVASHLGGGGEGIEGKAEVSSVCQSVL